MSLDGNLREILDRWGRSIVDLPGAVNGTETIAQIKQAFADDKEWNLNLNKFELDGQPLMTGQEFYSRFENLVSEAKKDIKFNGVDTKVRLTSKAYLLLAQKAAGLKNAK